MKTLFINARVILRGEIIMGSVLVENGKILTIQEGPWGDYPADWKIIDAEKLYLSPGFIDIHTHGAGGCDFMDGKDAIITASKSHMRHGTTTLLPTTVAVSREDLLKCTDDFKAAQREMKDGPHIPGLHLEGPYFSAEQKGAIDENFIRNPDPEEYKEVCERAGDSILRWSIAPERPGALEMGDYLAQRGILPTIGHSNAVYDEVRRAFYHGYTHVTHLYSGMSTITRKSGFRFPGVIESAYALEGLTVEIIADGCHLPIELLKMIWRLKGTDKICLISDSMRYADVKVDNTVADGLGSREGGQSVLIEDGVAKLMDRSAFAGSIATDDRLVRVMYHDAGIPLHECIGMMCRTPASIMGFQSKGSIEPGKDADLVLFDEDIQIKRVFVSGKEAYKA